jgi:hypothetical protein
MLFLAPLVLPLLLVLNGLAASAQESELSNWVMQYVSIPRGTIALVHAKVIDGTGTPAKDDQTIVISGSTIAQLGPSSSITVKGVVGLR